MLLVFLYYLFPGNKSHEATRIEQKQIEQRMLLEKKLQQVQNILLRVQTITQENAFYYSGETYLPLTQEHLMSLSLGNILSVIESLNTYGVFTGK